MTSNHRVHALECFEAAMTEGWSDALANGDIDRIRDLWARRVSFAYEALKSGETTADWKVRVHESSDAMWLRVYGPEGQQAAFDVPKDSVCAEVLRQYGQRLEKAPAASETLDECPADCAFKAVPHKHVRGVVGIGRDAVKTPSALPDRIMKEPQ